MKLEISQDKNNKADICGHVENFLTDEEINNFYSLQTKQFQPAQTRYRGIDKSIRDCDRIAHCNVPSWLYDKLREVINLYNSKTYNFKIWAEQEAHQFNIVRYKEKGQFFTVHRDCRPSLQHILFGKNMRKLSLSVQLTDSNEYGGGNLEVAESFTQVDILADTPNKMPENKFRHKFKTMRKKGSLTIFTSFHQHESTPLEWGKRDVLVGFISGEAQVW